MKLQQQQMKNDEMIKEKSPRFIFIKNPILFLFL